jgi:DNA glycosylase AlkZ-like
MRGLVRRRLVNQHLSRQTLTSPGELVASFGAIQAQDYAAAKWAVGQRLIGAEDATVERAMNEGSILRTHVLRPTWHFVAPADIRWMLALTSARVKAAGASQWRAYELDEPTFRRGNSAIEKALRGGKQLTRAELATALARAKVDVTSGVRVGHLLMRAELDALVCSGARRGKQFTYALLDERVAPTNARVREEALAELARRYFSTHGPATARDFAWWSGQTIADAKGALAMLAGELEHETVERQTFWFAPAALPRSSKPVAHLLANYDEYVVGLTDRSAMAERLTKLSASDVKALVFDHVILIDGQVVGTWPRTAGRDGGKLLFLTKVNAVDRQAISLAMEQYRRFDGPGRRA